MLKPVACTVALPGTGLTLSSTSYNVPPYNPGFAPLLRMDGRKYSDPEVYIIIFQLDQIILIN
jgi:hypothetical protein